MKTDLNRTPRNSKDKDLRFKCELKNCGKVLCSREAYRIHKAKHLKNSVRKAKKSDSVGTDWTHY